MKHLTFTCKNYSTAVSLAACLSLLCALPNAEFFECDQDPSAFREDFLRRPLFRLEGGLVWPNEEAGLGLDIDETRLAQWLVKP
jgi:D-galactarolactone cycloisomerase